MKETPNYQLSEKEMDDFFKNGFVIINGEKFTSENIFISKEDVEKIEKQIEEEKGS